MAQKEVDLIIEKIKEEAKKFNTLKLSDPEPRLMTSRPPIHPNSRNRIKANEGSRTEQTLDSTEPTQSVTPRHIPNTSVNKSHDSSELMNSKVPNYSEKVQIKTQMYVHPTLQKRSLDRIVSPSSQPQNHPDSGGSTSQKHTRKDSQASSPDKFPELQGISQERAAIIETRATTPQDLASKFVESIVPEDSNDVGTAVANLQMLKDMDSSESQMVDGTLELTEVKRMGPMLPTYLYPDPRLPGSAIEILESSKVRDSSMPKVVDVTSESTEMKRTGPMLPTYVSPGPSVSGSAIATLESLKSKLVDVITEPTEVKRTGPVLPTYFYPGPTLLGNEAPKFTKATAVNLYHSKDTYMETRNAIATTVSKFDHLKKVLSQNSSKITGATTSSTKPSLKKFSPNLYIPKDSTSESTMASKGMKLTKFESFKKNDEDSAFTLGSPGTQTKFSTCPGYSTGCYIPPRASEIGPTNPRFRFSSKGASFLPADNSEKLNDARTPRTAQRLGNRVNESKVPKETTSVSTEKMDKRYSANSSFKCTATINPTKTMTTNRTKSSQSQEIPRVLQEYSESNPVLVESKPTSIIKKSNNSKPTVDGIRVRFHRTGSHPPREVHHEKKLEVSPLFPKLYSEVIRKLDQQFSRDQLDGDDRPMASQQHGDSGIPSVCTITESGVKTTRLRNESQGTENVLSSIVNDDPELKMNEVKEQLRQRFGIGAGDGGNVKVDCLKRNGNATFTNNDNSESSGSEYWRGTGSPSSPQRSVRRKVFRSPRGKGKAPVRRFISDQSLANRKMDSTRKRSSSPLKSCSTRSSRQEDHRHTTSSFGASNRSSQLKVSGIDQYNLLPSQDGGSDENCETSMRGIWANPKIANLPDLMQPVVSSEQRQDSWENLRRVRKNETTPDSSLPRSRQNVGDEERSKFAQKHEIRSKLNSATPSDPLNKNPPRLRLTNETENSSSGLKYDMSQE